MVHSESYLSVIVKVRPPAEFKIKVGLENDLLLHLYSHHL